MSIIKIDASGQDVVGFVDRICKGLEWLGSKQMYLWRTEYSVEKLEKARNELRDTMEMAVGTMESALHNGWWPLKGPAKGWLREGQVAIGHANRALSLYKEQIGGDPTSIFLCPCETMSRRTLNARVIMRMNQILEHKSVGKVYDEGAFEDVACRRGGGDLKTTDPQATHSLLKARASLSLDDRIAALLGPLPVSPSHGSKTPPALPDKPTHIANPSDGPDAVVLDSGTPEVSSQQEAHIASSAEKMQLNAFTKYRALARSQSYQSVPVVIQVKAPRYTPRSRTPIDLVMVLDASGSMSKGERFQLMRMSSMFVVHNLEATDRLSIVVFSASSFLLLPLSAMSDEAKSLTSGLIQSLCPGGNTKLKPAMELAYNVLRERRPDEDRVSSIILLTDGVYEKQTSVESISFIEKYPTYVLGIGDDHDPRTLYSFATRGHGTYSFAIDDLESIRDAMALYIGGLTSIVSQDVRISIDSAHRNVRISGITCGGYNYSIDDRGKSGLITVNDLCGNEEKKFIVYVDVPEEEAAIFTGTPKTKLLTVASSYYSPLTGAHVHADTIEIYVDRPGRIRGQDHSISVEVASEVTRANVFKGVKEIWCETSKRPDLGTNWPAVGEHLTEKLNDLRDSINNIEESKATKDRWDDLSTDLDNMQQDISRIVSMSMEGRGFIDQYVTGSLAYMLSWLSSHQWQRAATPGSTSKSRWFSFRTVRMQNMIDSVESVSAFYPLS